jgi:hypothetical protein
MVYGPLLLSETFAPLLILAEMVFAEFVHVSVTDEPGEALVWFELMVQVGVAAVLVYCTAYLVVTFEDTVVSGEMVQVEPLQVGVRLNVVTEHSAPPVAKVQLPTVSV